MGETDGDMMRNGSEEVGRGSGECEEDEGTECEGGDRDIVWKRETDF